MTSPGPKRLRQNGRRKTVGLLLLALSAIGHAVAYGSGLSALHGFSWFPQIIGTILLLTGSEASIADEFIKIGFTTIPKDRITRVDMEEDSMCVHWTGKRDVTRSYLFRRAPYHPDDWRLLVDHLSALGVSRFDGRNFPPAEY